jgi:hypothetical protein
MEILSSDLFVCVDSCRLRTRAVQRRARMRLSFASLGQTRSLCGVSMVCGCTAHNSRVARTHALELVLLHLLVLLSSTLISISMSSPSPALQHLLVNFFLTGCLHPSLGVIRRIATRENSRKQIVRVRKERRLLERKEPG